MAEIKIEKKKPIWPWIVAILLISAVVYYIYFTDHHTQSNTNVQVEDSTRVDSTSN